MTEEDRTKPRPAWSYLIAGMVVGVALGILVSITTDLPLAPEAGLLIGAVVGWVVRRTRT